MKIITWHGRSMLRPYRTLLGDGIADSQKNGQMLSSGR
jgi:hypothetical protein